MEGLGGRGGVHGEDAGWVVECQHACDFEVPEFSQLYSSSIRNVERTIATRARHTYHNPISSSTSQTSRRLLQSKPLPGYGDGSSVLWQVLVDALFLVAL